MMGNQFDILKQCAEKGDAAAQWDLALYYCEHPEAEVCVGNFCEEHLDELQAVIWYKRAAKQGYTLGDYYLGLYYKEGRGGLPLDLKQAEQCFLRACNYVEAAYEYYECYRIRTGNDDENEEESGQAIRLLAQSANGGYAPAQYTLGRLYESFDDHEEARTYLEVLPNRGMLQQLNICVLYMHNNAWMPAISKQRSSI